MDFAQVRDLFVQSMSSQAKPEWLWLEQLDDWRHFAALVRLPWAPLRKMLIEAEGGWILLERAEV